MLHEHPGLPLSTTTHLRIKRQPVLLIAPHRNTFRKYFQTDIVKGKRFIFTGLYLLIIAIFFASCGETQAEEESDRYLLTDRQDSVSYVLGLEAGKDYLKKTYAVDPDAYRQGLLDGLYGVLSQIELPVATVLLAEAEEQMRKTVSELNRRRAAEFLKTNAGREGVVVTQSGLQYEILKPGFGIPPESWRRVEVKWSVSLLEPLPEEVGLDSANADTFLIAETIPAWKEALLLMKPGAAWKLYVPPALGYNDYPAKGIPRNSMLIFEIELVTVF